MPVESWLLPVLWREKDWRAAIARLATEITKAPASTAAHKNALELGRAFEYIEPDRRKAIAIYELADGHDLGRARELATELGWWAARARLCAGEPSLALDEAEAWWDAGQPELASLALSGVRGDDMRIGDLNALIAGTDRQAYAERIALRETADDFVMAARFAHPVRHLEAALAAVPGHPVAARMLLDHALAGRDADAVQRVVKARLAGLDGEASIDAMRSTALALMASEAHRGFGRRLIQQALEAAYEAKQQRIAGHLAMWAALVQRAIADGNKRDLLPLAIHAIECSPHAIDHVWLGALATEISLEAGNPVVAGAYAEIVAEHAPEHPVVRQLVNDVADATSAVPVEAKEAAHTAKHQINNPTIDLDTTYAEVVNVQTSRKKPPPPPPKKAEPAPEPAKPEARPVAAPAKSKSSIPPTATRSIVPAALSHPKPLPWLQPSPKLAAPVLAALRTPDRPLIPPKQEPQNAKQRARRISIPLDVKITMASGKVVEAHSRDFSTTGLFVLTAAPLAVGTVYAIDIMIPGAEAFSEVVHHAKAKVVRRDEGGYGIELISPDAKLLAALAAL